LGEGCKDTKMCVGERFESTSMGGCAWEKHGQRPNHGRQRRKTCDKKQEMLLQRLGSVLEENE